MTRAAPKRGEQGWRFLTLALALAFALQSFVTQTHIHGTGPDAGASAIVKVVKGPLKPQAPFDSSDSSCPFCQAIAHAGVFNAPGAPLLLPPSVWSALSAPLAVLAVLAGFAAHNWQSRAPPHA